MSDLRTYRGGPLEPREPVWEPGEKATLIRGEMEFEDITIVVVCDRFTADFSSDPYVDSTLDFSRCQVESMKTHKTDYEPKKPWYRYPKQFTFTFPEGGMPYDARQEIVQDMMRRVSHMVSRLHED